MENTIKNANVEYTIKISIPMHTPVFFLLSDNPEHQKDFLNNLIKAHPENKQEIVSTIEVIKQAHQLNATDIKISSIDVLERSIKIKIKFKNRDDLNKFCTLFNI